MPNMPWVVVAAAGRGTRFGNSPKLLAPVGGVPCVRRVVEVIEQGLGPHRQVVVVGHAAEQVAEVIGDASHRLFVYQPRLRGTGDVLQQALKAIPMEDGASVFFFCGDKPLLRPETVSRFRQEFEATQSDMMFLVGLLEGEGEELHCQQQGRVVHGADEAPAREVLGIAEYKVIRAMEPGETRCYRDRKGRQWRFTQSDLLAIREVNVSTYAWRGRDLWAYQHELRANNPQGELLITDLVEIYQRHGRLVSTAPVAFPEEGWGIDTVEQWNLARGLADRLK